MSRYIDADKLSETIKEHAYLLCDSINSRDYGMFLDGIMQAIDETPTANVQEVRHGGWIFRGDYTSMCSCCNNDVEVDHEKEPKYCPECGAKMDAGE